MASSKKKLTIKPTIEDGKVRHVDVGYESLPLIKPIDLVDFPDFIEKLEAIAEYVDFAGRTGWTEEELDVFLHREITTKAKQFFEILAFVDSGQWVRKQTILDVMDIQGRALAGVLSSPGQFFSRWRKDPIYESEERLVEGETSYEELHYRLKQKYKDDVREVLT